MSSRASVFILVAAVAPMGLVSGAQALVIDDFTKTTLTTIELPTGAATLDIVDAPVAPTGMIGTQRTIHLEQSTIGGSFGQVKISAATSPDGLIGYFDYTSPSRRDGAIELTWDVPAGLSNLSGTQAIAIDFVAYDQANALPMTVSASVIGGVTETTAAVNYSTQGVATLNISLAGITPALLSNVSSLKLRFDPPVGGDFTLTKVSTVVPEPSSIALVLPAAALLVRRRRA